MDLPDVYLTEVEQAGGVTQGYSALVVLGAGENSKGAPGLCSLTLHTAGDGLYRQVKRDASGALLASINLVWRTTELYLKMQGICVGYPCSHRDGHLGTLLKQIGAPHLTAVEG